MMPDLNDPSTLLCLDADAFKKVVDQDLRTRSNTGLRSPAVLERWHAELVRMSKSVDGQLAAMREEYEGKRAEILSEIQSRRECLRRKVKRTPQGEFPMTEFDEEEYRKRIAALETQKTMLRTAYATSRAGKLRFKTGVEESLPEATRLRNELHSRMRELEKAIVSHRSAVLGEDFEPTPNDTDLWRVVDER